MEMISTFYGTPAHLRKLIFDRIESVRLKRGLTISQLESLSELKRGTWEKVLRDLSSLSREHLLSICFGLELNIENAMPLQASPSDLVGVRSSMSKKGHKVTHACGHPGIDGDPEEVVDDEDEVVMTDSELGLYIRLRALDELEELQAQVEQLQG